MADILVAWWRSPSRGSEGSNPHINWAPEGTDDEIERFIDDELLYGAGENEHSEHWRGVAFRRLTPQESLEYVQKQLVDSVVGFFSVMLDTDEDILLPILRRLSKIEGFTRGGMEKTTRLFKEALE